MSLFWQGRPNKKGEDKLSDSENSRKKEEERIALLEENKGLRGLPCHTIMVTKAREPK